MEIKGYKDFYKQDKLSIYNMDNMELMKQIPDKYFDLAIIDPPYGISADKDFHRKSGYKGTNQKAKNSSFLIKNWDNETPSKEYFLELFRISKNQVIWGGNYMIENINKNSNCWIVWDKDNNTSDFADCELAWTSFKSAVRKIKLKWNGMLQCDMANKETRIHPTQKPISLYSWILEKYAKKGMKIFDSHLGSGSNAIACHYAEMEFIGCELDIDYYNDSIKRIKENTRQLSLLNLEN